MLFNMGQKYIAPFSIKSEKFGFIKNQRNGLSEGQSIFLGRTADPPVFINADCYRKIPDGIGFFRR